MHPLAGLAQETRWAARNLVYNLAFVPPEKLAWKPAPTAKSALEVVNHLAGTLRMLTPVLQGEPPAEPQFLPAENLEAARALLLESADAAADAMERVEPAELERVVDLPFGSFSVAMLAGICAVDTIHHHGQIAYIQTLLGDEESHFDPNLT